MTQRHNERLKQWCNSWQGKLYFSRCLKRNGIIRLHIQNSDSSDEDMSRCWVMRGRKHKSSNNCRWLSGAFYFKNRCPCVTYWTKRTIVSWKRLSTWKSWRGREGKCFTKSQTGERLTKKLKKTLLIDPELKLQLLSVSFYTSSCFIIITKLGTKCKNNYKLTTIFSHFKSETECSTRTHCSLQADLAEKTLNPPSGWFTGNQYIWFDFGQQRSEPLLQNCSLYN